jgi:hypothetical protein
MPSVFDDWYARVEAGGDEDWVALFKEMSLFIGTQQGIREWMDWVDVKDGALEVNEGERMGLVWKTIERLVETMPDRIHNVHLPSVTAVLEASDLMIFVYMKTLATAYAQVLVTRFAEQTFPRPLGGTLRDENFVCKQARDFLDTVEQRAWYVCYPRAKVYAYLSCTAFHGVVPFIHSIFDKQPVARRDFLAELMALDQFDSHTKGWAIAAADMHGVVEPS